MLHRVAFPFLAATLAIASGSVLAQSTPTPSEPAPPAVTTLLPSNVAGVILLNTEVDAWTSLAQFQLFAEATGMLQQIPALFLGVDFATEVQPWLGDRVAVALMPVADAETDTTSDAASETLNQTDQTLLLAPVKDASALQPFLAKMESMRGKPPVTREYNGVKILEWEAEALPPCEEVPAAPPDSSLDTGSEENAEAEVETNLEQNLNCDPTLEPAPEPEAETPGARQISPRSSVSWLSPGRGKAVSLLQSQEPVLQPESLDPPVPVPSESEPDAELEPIDPEVLPPEASPEESIEPTAQAKPGLAIALLSGYIATASTPAPLQQLIDARQQNEPLIKNPLFQRTLQNPQFERSLIVAYGNLEEIAKFPVPSLENLPIETPESEPTEDPELAPTDELEPAPSEEPTEDPELTPTDPMRSLPAPLPQLPFLPFHDVTTPPSASELINGLQSFAAEYGAVDAYVWVQPEGIRSQINSYYKTPQPEQADVLTPDADQVLSRLPASTYVSASSRNFNQQWQTVLEAAEQEAETLKLQAPPQLEEAEDYLRSRWQPPEALTESLEYSLQLNPDGSIQSVVPIGQVSSATLTQANIPNVGEPFVSPTPDGMELTMLVTLSPDGEVEAALESASTEPTLQEALTTIREGVRALTGLDLEKDIISWLDGEYAAFLFPTKQGFFSQFYPNLDLGVGLIVQTSDRATAEATLNKLDESVRSSSGNTIAIATRPIKGQPVTSWEYEESGNRQSFLAHSWVDDNTLIITNGFGPMTELAPKPYIPLNQSYTFKTATESLARPNQGYFYLNAGSSLSFLYGLFSPYSNSPEFRDIKRWLGSVYSISATNSATPEKQQFDSLFVLAPVRQP